ncbi:uncharacterized protein LOC123672411 [Harmonia axyridis]|uniref:uncharacterized protein LOC123672411 n=1 Tax=Harmonia axyridis TaxID=115357 RepID=UPI001E276C7C|nr:uncharacterized protein LOC123672411 [Harmonia axyridis]
MSRGSYCLVLTCPNNKNKNPKLAFFTLPKDMKIAKSWIEFSGRKDLGDLGASKDYRMCSEHFTENQFKCIYPRTLLWRGSIPHVNGPKSDVLPESESKMIIHEETVQTDQNVPLSDIDVTMESEGFIEARSSSATPKRSGSKLSPLTNQRIERMKAKINSLKCKIFRRKVPHCFCK